jgi:hypothetical protein
VKLAVEFPIGLWKMCKDIMEDSAPTQTEKQDGDTRGLTRTFIREPLRMSSLKEGAAGEAGE